MSLANHLQLHILLLELALKPRAARLLRVQLPLMRSARLNQPGTALVLFLMVCGVAAIRSNENKIGELVQEKQTASMCGDDYVPCKHGEPMFSSKPPQPLIVNLLIFGLLLFNLGTMFPLWETDAQNHKKRHTYTKTNIHTQRHTHTRTPKDTQVNTCTHLGHLFLGLRHALIECSDKGLCLAVHECVIHLLLIGTQLLPENDGKRRMEENETHIVG